MSLALYLFFFMHAEVYMLPLIQCGILCNYLYKSCSGCIVWNNPDLCGFCIPTACCKLQCWYTKYGRDQPVHCQRDISDRYYYIV